MSSQATQVSRQLLWNRNGPVGKECENSGTHPFLLHPDPEAMLQVELVDHPIELPQDQFTALLIDSECEV